MAVGDIHSDGTVVWKEDFVMGLSKLSLVVGYNHKETYTSSGSFTAPITGLYKITLHGGGSGGGGAWKPSSGFNFNAAGPGGGQGGHLEFYETLTAGATYTYTIGAGGSGGTKSTTTDIGRDSSDGGASSITINSRTYTANGGGKTAGISGGSPGTSLIDGVAVGVYGLRGENATYDGSVPNILGGTGGNGTVGASKGSNSSADTLGNGGSGGSYWNSTPYNGGAGGDGYIVFEWFDPADVWPDLFPSTP